MRNLKAAALSALLIGTTCVMAACTTTDRAFDCAGAEGRRALYQQGINVANAAILSGGPGVQAALIARTVAETSLAVVNARCPMDADDGR